MKKQNVIFVTPTGSKVVIAKGVYYTSFTGSNGSTSHFYVTQSAWENFKKATSYSDSDFAYCVCSDLVPGRFELVNGTYLIETID